MPKSTNSHPYTFDGDKGPYINTYSGRSFHVLHPEPEDIDIIDIAHHLSLQCRSVGAVTRHYSVAQHSLFVWQLVSEQTDDPIVQMQAHMYDSEEYVTGDWPTPVKCCIPGILTVAKNIKRAIGEKYGIDLIDMPPIIKHMDNVAMATEKEQLYIPSDVIWHKMPEPDKRVIPEMSPQEAEKLFIDKSNELAIRVLQYEKGDT